MQAAIEFAPERESAESLSKKLNEAKTAFNRGDTKEAIQLANELRDKLESSAFASEFVGIEAKALLLFCYLKSQQSEQARKVGQALLVDLQESMPMDPSYAQHKSQILASAPATLKEHLESFATKLDDKSDFRAQTDSLISDLVPSNYEALLRDYSKRMNSVLKEVEQLYPIAEAEETNRRALPVSTSSETGKDNEDVSADHSGLTEVRTNQLYKTLDTLATQTEKMPVGDLSAASSLLTLALVASHDHRYAQSEQLSRRALTNLEILAPTYPLRSRTERTLAYSLLKQNKKDEFVALIASLVKRADDEEQLVGLARLSVLSGETALASELYGRALSQKRKVGAIYPPVWLDEYTKLLESLNRQTEAKSANEGWRGRN